MPKKLSSAADTLPIPVEMVARRIFLIRGQKVMLDGDLAELYQVETRSLVQAVKRNLDRFPDDFMFQLSPEEAAAMRAQSVTASKRNIRYQPYAFTEHGALMLSSVLKSKRAVQMSIRVVRVFIQMREILASNKDLAARLERLEAGQKRHTSALGVIVDEIKKLKQEPAWHDSFVGWRGERDSQRNGTFWLHRASHRCGGRIHRASVRAACYFLTLRPCSIASTPSTRVLLVALAYLNSGQATPKRAW